ncbi:hypothetical protein L7F22_046168 [Adiantum nelumboides]|nr:hypothetical protein [Adiantum nelumboides]
MADAEVEDGDLQTIRDVVSVHHVPVVASLHWDKLHSILHSLCDRIATQALRLEKAEEQGKNFLGLKDELGQLCQNAVKEMKDAKEIEVEQQQQWLQMVEDRLQALQQGLDANSNNVKRFDDLDVPSTLGRLDALEEANKKLDRLDALEEATKKLEAIQASQPISLDSLNQKLEELVVDFEEQSEKLHTLEVQNEKLKLQLDQMGKSNASDLEALQQYCKVSVTDAKSAAVEELSPRLVDELTKDVKSAIEKHDKDLIKVQKEFGMLGRSILLLLGHQHEYLRIASTKDPAEKLGTILEGLGGNVPIVLPADTLNGTKRSSKLLSGSDIAMNGSVESPHVPRLSAKHTLLGNLDQMDDTSVSEAIAEALRTNKFEPKSNVKVLVKLSEDFFNLLSKFNEFDTVTTALKEGLSLKAERLIYRSCDHSVEKLSPLPGEHLPTNRMPPQVLPMLSAERIFALDRRGSSGAGVYNSSQYNKPWSESFSNGGSRHHQRGIPPRRSASPRKSTTHS